MEDDMLFCQKCGEKSVVIDGVSQKVKTPFEEQPTSSPVHTPMQQTTAHSNSLRKSMKIWTIVCLVFAGMYAIIGIAIGEPAMAVGMSGFFGVLAVMFLVLSKSPKGNPFLLGKQSGLKKTIFVLICFVVSFAVVGVSAGTMDGTTSQREGQGDSQSPINTQKNNDTSSSQTTETPENGEATAVTLSDIQKWYEAQMPSVSQTLLEYAQSVTGISNINVTESKFRFGENSGWYDCHYTMYFTCKVDGKSCTGEARAFLKYNDNNITWFHFEIFRDSDYATIVEHYDDSYDQIIEDYYKELYEQYD